MMSGNEERFQQAMNQGHSAAWDQMWDRAAVFYRQALDEFPNHPKALTSLGLALYELQEYKEALRYYLEATKVSPEDPVPLEKVAELHERMGNLDQASDIFMSVAELYAKSRMLDKAIESWTRVTRLNPEHSVAHSRLAMVFERMGRKQQAVTEYMIMTSLLQHAGEVQKAIQTANHALQLAPTSPEVGQALNMLKTGQLLPKPMRARGATGPLLMAQVRQLEKSKQQDAAKPGLDPIETARQSALTHLAGMLFDQDDQETQAAKRGMQKIVAGTGILSAKDQTRVVLHLSQTIDLQSRGKVAEAIDELEHAIDAGLESAAASFNMGLLMAEAGRVESAIRHLQRAVTHHNYALGARLVLAQTLKDLDRYQEAAIECLEALKLADSAVVPLEQADDLRQMYDPLIEAQTQQTDAQQQEQVINNILDLLVRPNWEAHLLQARQQLPDQDAGSPPTPLAEILTQARGSRLVEAISKIQEYSRTGYLRAAMEEAFYALQHAPTYLPLHTYIGDLLMKQQQVKQAVDKFSIVAQSYSSRGEPGRAVEIYRRIIDISSMDMNVRARLIDQLKALGKVEEAIIEYLNLAEVYITLADFIAARKTYTLALRLAQSTNMDRALKIKILNRMADIDLQSLDWRQALLVYEQIRTLQPDDENARATLIDLNSRLNQLPKALAELDSYISYLMGEGSREKAVQFVENLVKEYPKQARIRRRLAELYRQSGRIEDAINQLDSAGECLIENGDKQAAVEVIMGILALNPPNAGEYQQLLAQLKAS